MTVLYLSHFFVSGLYRRKLAALRRHGVRAVGLAPHCWIDDGRREDSDGQPGEAGLFHSVRAFLPGSGSLYFFSPLALFRAFRAARPDILHIDEEPWSLSCLQSILTCWAACPTARILFDTSENLDKSLPWPVRLVERLTFLVSRSAIAISREVMERLRRVGFTGPVRVVGHGIDTEAFRPRDRAAARGENGVMGEFVVGFVGIVTRRKGVFVLLEAFRRAALPGARLLWVGAGDALEDLRAACAMDPALAASVTFVGPVAHDRVRGYLNCLDVLVLPSLTTPRWKEQFGRILIEAMASGAVVVGSDSGGIPDVIGEAGIVVPEGDTDRLAAVLTMLRRSPARRRDLERKGRSRVEELYSWDGVAAEVSEAYRECLRRA